MFVFALLYLCLLLLLLFFFYIKGYAFVLHCGCKWFGTTLNYFCCKSLVILANIHVSDAIRILYLIFYHMY